MPILIWDLPTRLFHWTLVGSFALAWLTAESDPWLSVHVFAGYLMLGLVAFRVLGFRRFALFALCQLLVWPQASPCLPESCHHWPC